MIQCWLDVGPTSTTSAQHEANSWSLSRCLAFGLTQLNTWTTNYLSAQYSVYFCHIPLLIVLRDADICHEYIISSDFFLPKIYSFLCLKFTENTREIVSGVVI